MNKNLQAIRDLESCINLSILGQENVVERLLIVLLANGNLLLGSLLGLAKTRAITSLAQNLDAGLSQIQFTPDLLPSNITGTELYQIESEEKFDFQQGPIFNNLILADEINRAPAKVQSALLEAMQEHQVTVAGKTHKLEPLFMVMAKQNQIEQVGTYPLPEVQMDRFLMHVIVNYPNAASETKVLDLVSSEEDLAPKEKTEVKIISQNVNFEARTEINKTRVSKSIKTYIEDFVNATLYPNKYSENLGLWINYGASTRASIALDKCSRVNAWLNERNFVNPDDVRVVAHDTLRHRISQSYDANA
jgi:MoxR-like ATPase